MTNFRYIFLYAAVNILSSAVINEAIQLTKVEDEDNVVCDDTDPQYVVVSINENLESALLFYIENFSEPIVIGRFPCDALTYELVPHNGKTAFNLTSPLDYENQNCQIITNTIQDKTTNLCTFDLRVNNLDDNPPELILSENCEFKENTNYTIEKTPCSITMTDADGMMGSTNFSISPEEYRDTFQVSFLEAPTDIEKNAEVKIFLASGKQLDFESTTQYFFTVLAQETVQKGSVHVTVLVQDMPDQPPKFKKIFASQTFEENVDQEFTIKAIDGDIGINDEINYEIVESGCDNYECTINIGTKDGVIIVKNVDREEVGNSITFVIRAYEVNDKNETLSDVLYFFIKDQDDNIPTFILEEPFNFTVDENFADSIIDFEMQDMDLGDNGTYKTTMDCEGFEIDYCSAFQIIPSQGFNEASFTLHVKNSSKLDYDDQVEDWKNIEFDIVATEVYDKSHVTRKTVNIHLKDLNDEPPIFDNTEDSVDIKEDVTKETKIFNASASDRDAYTTITYRIIGIWGEKLNVGKTGEITTAIDDVFDYETLPEVAIQISASDNDFVHTTYKTLTINVIDVDDEPPTIKVNPTNGIDRVPINEGGTPGERLSVKIIASDPDTKPKLELEIDWDSSYAMKNSGVRKYKDNEWRCFDLIVEEHEELSREIIGYLETNQLCRPDFELYDTVVMSLKVIDENTVKRSNFSKALLQISIQDINDNPPVFDLSTFKDLKVTDGTDKTEVIGKIDAHDPDINDTVTFSIRALEESYDWVDINSETGQLTIKDGVKINDDYPPKQNITFMITASDGLHLVDELLSIHIVDINNQKPFISQKVTNVTIPEKVKSLDVISLEATDLDRDEPYNTIAFRFDNGVSDEVLQNFQISSDGKITVTKDANLDRDFGTQSYILLVSTYDDPAGYLHNVDSLQLQVTLQDVNDNPPKILNTTLSCSENMKKGGIISNIIADDPDEGVNAEANFEILDIIPRSTTENTLTKEDLSIESDDYKTATLTLLRDLESYFGEYDLTIRTFDNGSPSQSCNNTINLVVAKFNFYAPAFVFPESSDTITLNEDQSITSDQPLKLYNEDDLQDFEVNDFQNHKWSVTFEIIKQTGSSSNLFSIQNFGTWKGRLKLTRHPDQDDKKNMHTITIEASVKAERLEDEKAISVQKDVNIKFFSATEEPEFEITNFEIDFDEDAPEEHDSPDPPQQIPEARFPSGVNLPVYYKLRDNNDFFELTNRNLSVKQELHFNEHPSFDIEIAAFKNPNSITPAEKSILSVHINVIALNINKPIFHPSKFNGALLKSYPKDTTIVTVTATDDDAADNGKLTFSIDDIFCEKSVNAPTNPFEIDSTRGTIASTFTVTSDMSGYCTMNVHVSDNEDKYHMQHTVSTTVQINIISTDELVRFTFLNEDSFISANQEKITSSIDEIFKQYNYKSNLADLKYDNEWRNTTADFYFLNSKEVPVQAKEILSKLTDFDEFLTLKQSLGSLGVNLGNFPGEFPTDVEDYFKVWLIASTIVLATFLVLVSIAFFFRNRALTKRISNLSTNKFGSQDSNLNRAGLAAPTTNKNAVEGSNPVFITQNVYNTEKEIDTQSINSTDSDLLGVENNSEFDL